MPLAPVHGSAVGTPMFKPPKSKQFERGMKMANVPGGRPELVEKDNTGLKHVSGVPVVQQKSSDKFDMSGVMRFRGRNPKSVDIPSSVTGPRQNVDRFGNQIYPWTGSPEEKGIVATGSFSTLYTQFVPGISRYAAGHSGSSAFILGGFSTTGSSGSYASGSHVSDCYEFKQASGSWYPFPALPSARSRSAAYMMNGVITLVGGEGSDSNIPSYVLMYTSLDGIWTTLSSSNISRRDAQLAPIDEEFILLGPGYDYQPGSGSLEYRSIYNGNNRVVVNSLPIAPFKREGYTMTSLGGGKVLLLGGIDSDTGIPTSHAFLYQAGSWVVLPSMSLPRAYHEAIYTDGGGVTVLGGITSGTENMPYIFGAPSKGYPQTTSLIEYVTASQGEWMWSTRGEMLQARSHFGCAIYNSDGGRIFSSGGKQGLMALSSSEVFDVENSVSRPVSDMPEAFFGHKTFAVLCNESQYEIVIGPGERDVVPPARSPLTSSFFFRTTG